MTLREAKVILREALQSASDQKLAEMLAWAQDGKMDYFNCCACFAGSLGAESVHDDCSLWSNFRKTGLSHYHRIMEVYPGASDAYYDIAYRMGIDKQLLRTSHESPVERAELRQRRIIPIIKAQIRLRERRASRTSLDVPVEVTA